jgi:hypothetical protein
MFCAEQVSCGKMLRRASQLEGHAKCSTRAEDPAVTASGSGRLVGYEFNAKNVDRSRQC